MDGTSLYKIIISNEEKYFLEPKKDLISYIYKLITNRKIILEFKDEMQFAKYKIPK